MKYNSNIHHRRSVRLKEYDYSKLGGYFVTVVTYNKEYLFGNIINGNVILNDPGQMIQEIWNDLPKYYHEVEIDSFIIMPNHVHGVIFLTDNKCEKNVGAGPRACPKSIDNRDLRKKGQPQGVAPTLSLPDIVHRFKTMTTKQYCDGVAQNGWTPFSGKLWQRNYYEHVIRNEKELSLIREYIVNNPLKWELDKNNLENLYF